MEDDFISILTPDHPSNSENESSSSVNIFSKNRSSSSSLLQENSSSNVAKKQDLTPLTAFQFTKLNPSPWICKDFRYSKDPTKRLHQEILHFIQYATPTAQEHEARMETVRSIEQTILRAYPEAQVKVFGSYDTKLYLPSADIDLVLFGAFGSGTVSSYNGTGANLLRRVARLLVQAGIAVESSVKIISKARIPIIKFTDAAFHFDVDMSFNVESGLESAEIMKALVEIIPSIKPLTLVIKQFLSIRKLNEVFSGGLGSYSITLLIVSFLQMHPLVQAKLIKPEENYGVLLVEFFELYGKLFNYERVGISLRNGGFYFDKVARGWCNSERFMLCLEDPQNEANDVAKSSFALAAVKQTFEHSYNLLTWILRDLDVDADESEDKQHFRRNFNAERGERIEEKKKQFSILSAVLFIEDDVLKHREFIAAKMEKAANAESLDC